MRTPVPSSAASPPRAPRLAISSLLSSSQPLQARVAARQSIAVMPKAVAAKIKPVVSMTTVLDSALLHAGHIRGPQILRNGPWFRRRRFRPSFVPQGEDRVGAGDLEGVAGDGADRDDQSEQAGQHERRRPEIDARVDMIEPFL